MGALSNFLEDAWLRTLGGTAFSVGTCYVALFTAAPGETGGGTEVTGGAYARQTITGLNTAGGWNNPVAGEPTIMDNFSLIQFPTATGDWGTVTSVGIFDALTNGNLLYFGNLTQSKVVSNGDTFKFNAGALDLGVG